MQLQPLITLQTEVNLVQQQAILENRVVCIVFATNVHDVIYL